MRIFLESDDGSGASHFKVFDDLAEALDAARLESQKPNWPDAFRCATVGSCSESGMYLAPYRGPGMVCPMDYCLDYAGRATSAPQYHYMRKRRAWICSACLCALYVKDEPPWCHCDRVERDADGDCLDECLGSGAFRFA